MVDTAKPEVVAVHLSNREKRATVAGEWAELKNRLEREPSALELSAVTGVSYPSVVKYCKAAGLILRGRVVGRILEVDGKEAVDGR